MRFWVRSFGNKLSQWLGGRSSWKFNGSEFPALIAEPLEERRVMTVELGDLSSVAGELNQSGQWECEDPTIAGVIDGVVAEHWVRLDFDFNGDGSPEDYRVQAGGINTFSYDPRTLLPGLAGLLELRARATELDADGITELGSSSWASITMSIPDPAPTLDGLTYTSGEGDDYVFTGQVSGVYAAGSTVSFTGLFSDSTVVDAYGNFSITRAFPNGANGMLYVTVTDANSHTTEGSLDVSIPDPTLTLDEFAYSGGEGDDYVFTGQVSGVYAAGSTVSFSGLFSGSAIVDIEGNFSTTQAFPTGGYGTLYATVTDNHSHTAEGALSVGIADPAPTLNGLTYSSGGGDDYVFTGQVSGVYAAGSTVSFSGLFSGSTVVGADGNFSITQAFPTAAYGTLYATVTDTRSHTGGGSLYVSIPDPTLTLDGVTYSSGAGDDYVFAGRVAGLYAAGSTINFSGLFSGSTVADAAGNFAITQAFPTGAYGTLYVTAMDLHSHSAGGSVYVGILDPTPTLDVLTYSTGAADNYIFTGRVSGVYAAGSTISFSGLFSGSTVADFGGNFSFSSSFPTGAYGTLYATITDTRSHTGGGSLYVSIPEPAPSG